MEKEKKGYSILIIFLFAVVCFLTVYILVNRKAGNDCSATPKESQVTQNDSNITKNETEYKSPIIDLYYVEDEPTLKINENKVELDENTRSVSDITTLKDMAVFVQSDPGFWILTFADSNGKIIKKITYNDVSGNGFSNYEIKGNNIYITSHLLAQDGIAVTCNQKRENKNEDVVFTEKMEYLGEGKFSNFTLEKTIKTNEYIESHNIICE